MLHYLTKDEDLFNCRLQLLRWVFKIWLENNYVLANDFLAAEVQLNTFTFLLSVCPSMVKPEFSQLMTTYDNLGKLKKGKEGEAEKIRFKDFYWPFTHVTEFCIGRLLYDSRWQQMTADDS